MEEKNLFQFGNTEDRLFATQAKEHWQRVGICPHHGIAVPLFSLHTAQSIGIGEFLDLLPLIDWCKDIGMDVIQLLPLNDSGADTSPYNAISAFALNPMYISLFALPNIDASLHAQLLEMRKLLQHSTRLDYATVRHQKIRFLHSYFTTHKERLINDSAYQAFINDNPWVAIYAIFVILKTHAHGKPWTAWSDLYSDPSEELIASLADTHQERISFYSWLQFVCDQQMQQVKKHAVSKGVFLMGDIPILISRDSADVWFHRSLFHTEYAAGAPPDQYSELGQNWGSPIYQWSEHQRTGYSWWKQRLKTASRYYHIYRIDHIVGFFRIWAIPPGKTGKEGQFIPGVLRDWMTQGINLMHMMLQSSPLLPIGEDLGVVPREVKRTLQTLGICGTKVMRWERLWDKGDQFLPLNAFLPESLTTVSTHDSEPLQLWWIENPKEAAEFAAFKRWTFSPRLSHEHHEQILYDSHHTTSLFHINPLQEYLALFSELHWEDPKQERINVPGTISKENWTYRCRPSIEQLSCHYELGQLMTRLLKD
jgi:4-alpha-glucanotransferase